MHTRTRVILIQMTWFCWPQVREAASEAAGAALQALGIEGVSHGAHVELVLRQAFQLLGSRCLHLSSVQQYLLQLIFRFVLI